MSARSGDGRGLLVGLVAATVVSAFASTCAASALGLGASGARTVVLSETGHLRLTSRHGFTLNEKGSASGTIRGTIYIHLKVVATNRVTAEVNIYPAGGSLTGKVDASYRVTGATAGFSGAMAIVRGTGRYSHARGSGLRFYGSIRRSDDAVTVYLSGQISV
jgi:hypothetical protein